MKTFGGDFLAKEFLSRPNENDVLSYGVATYLL